MANKSIKVKQPQPNRQDPDKPYYKECGSVVVDERVYDKILETGTSVTVFPHFIPDGRWTGRAWAEDDDGGSSKKKW